MDIKRKSWLSRVRPAGLGLVLCLVVTAALADAPKAGSPEQEYEQALKTYQSGDMVGAMPGLHKAADQGYAPAQTMLAYILNKSENNALALKYYRLAAEQGYAPGQYGLGSMYASGDAGKRDPAQALLWIRRAAEQGNQDAIRAMAAAYRTGDLGLEPDLEQARLWASRMKVPEGKAKKTGKKAQQQEK